MYADFLASSYARDSSAEDPDAAFAVARRVYELLARAEATGACRDECMTVRRVLRHGGPAAVLADEEAPKWALWVARNLGEDGPDVEAVIGRDPWVSMQYVREALYGGRFPAGEAAIATDPWTALDYAEHVLGGRFEAGEAAIAADPDTAEQYAELLAS